MDGFAIFIFVAVVALIIWVIVYSAMQQKKRRQALAAWAASQGYAYRREEDRAIPDRYQHFDPLRQGLNRYAENIISGDSDGLPFLLFDYHYETHSTDSKGNRQTHHHHFTACIIETGLRFPSELKVRPEGFFDKLAAAVGFNDIDFESNEFSKKFHVKSRDKKFAYDVIHQRMMEFLLANPGRTFEIEGNAICVTQGGRRLDAASWNSLLRFSRLVLEQLPDYLIDQLKT